jgi:hypothetical protein
MNSTLLTLQRVEICINYFSFISLKLHYVVNLKMSVVVLWDVTPIRRYYRHRFASFLETLYEQRDLLQVLEKQNDQKKYLDFRRIK